MPNKEVTAIHAHISVNDNSMKNHSVSWRTFAILIAILLCQLTLSERAEAATAHCLGRIQDTSGNVVADLNGSQGYVSVYNAWFPQDPTHQDQCVADVAAAASSWMSNSGQMCHAFFAANNSALIFYYKLGSLSWRDSGHATTPSAYNYPQSCFNLSGSIFPSYYIITLIYTPPGCTPSTSSTGYTCGSGSSVSYASGSSAGSTVSIDKSFGISTSLTAKLNSTFSVSGSYAQTSTSGSSVTISKDSNYTVTWPNPGPAGPDGINHDYDQFFIILNPLVAMSGWHDPVSGQNHVQWSLGTKNGAPMRIQRVQVSYLRCALAGIGPRPGNSGNGGGPSVYDPTGSCSANSFLQMQGPADASASNGWLPGLTYDDYKQILAQDLFWDASPSNRIPIPTPRFAQQSTDFTYDQAGGPQGSSCADQTQSISNSNTTTNSSSTQRQYQASMSLSPEFQLKLESTTSLTWTNTTSHSLTNANSQTATATVGCTSINWTGVDFVSAYYDTMYGTFLFALDDGTGRARVLQGTITDMDGDLVPHEPLKLVIGNKSYQSFSHNNGSFRIYLPAGETSAGATTATLFVGSSGGISKPVSIGPQANTTVVIPTPAPSLSVALGRAPVGPTALPTDALTARMASPAVLTANPIYIAVSNRSLFATAKNVTVTSIQATSQTGSPLVYNGSLPFTVRGGTALRAGGTVSFPLTFTGTGSLSFLAVTVKADNLAPFSTVLVQPGKPSQ